MAGFGAHGEQPNHIRRRDAIRGGELVDHPTATMQTAAHTAPDIKRVRKAIASFLCDVHFLRAFPSRDDTICVTFGAAAFIRISR
jgi:hypothetical protein